MLQRLGHYKYLAIAVILALVLIGASGYFFANQKSTPVFANKIEKLMYDRKNQSPRYILAIPDLRKPKMPKPAPLPATDEQGNAQEYAQLPPPPEKEKTFEDVLANMPNLQNLTDEMPTRNLKYITLNDDLTQSYKNKLLPRIDNDGRKPWSEYGVAVDTLPTFKKVAVIIKGAGFNPMSLAKINKAFTSEVGISYSPYAHEIGTKILSSRQQGHETYVDLLLSSKDFLKSDSGPLSMSLTITPEQSIERLRKSLSTGAPVGGVVVNDGIADDDNREMLTGLLEELQRRGLLMIDATHGDGIEKIEVDGLARAKADFIIEYVYDREKIREILSQAEQKAYDKGWVLIVIDPKPIIVVEVYDWLKSFSPQLGYQESKDIEITKPLALVPVSNLVVE